MLYKVVLTFQSVDEILDVTIPIKATEQHFPVLRISVYHAVQRVVLTFESADKFLV